MISVENDQGIPILQVTRGHEICWSKKPNADYPEISQGFIEYKTAIVDWWLKCQLGDSTQLFKQTY